MRNNIIEEMGFVDDGIESSDPDYTEEVYSDSDNSEEISDEEGNVESDPDEELEEIREKKKMLREGLIDPLKEGNLIDMTIGNGLFNVPVEHAFNSNEEIHHAPRNRDDTDPALGETPVWQDVVEKLSHPMYAENQNIGCDRVEKVAEENDDSDSFELDSIGSSDSSDDEELDFKRLRRCKEKKKEQKPCYRSFNPNTAIDHVEFEPGLIFTSREQLRDAIRNYGVAKQRRVYIKRSDYKRLQAKCREGCKWELWASRLEKDEAYQVKTYKKEHNCIIVSKQRMVKANWLSKEFGNTIRSNPRWKLKEFAAAVNAKFKIQCTLNQCWWAKKAAMSELESVLNEHYARLWDYGAEILRTNPGSSLFIKGEVGGNDENPTFQRLYVCFDALKKGFLNGCRKVIGLDGCFLKGYVKGELLTAIGRDGNNQMFPIAWAVVEVENTESWVWFTRLLKVDLNIGDGYSYTFITDQQKGLKNAIDEWLPEAEHRCCARHIHANWKKNHPGSTLKAAFWKAAKASTIADFNICMNEIKSISPFAYDDLLKTNPKYWSRAYFKTLSHCDVVDNNLSECFNSWILEARYKPIISMLDHIRVQCMERIHVKRDYMARIDTDLCPRIIKKLNYNIEGSKMCTSTWDGGDKCEVKDIEGNQFEVDMKNRNCSCRKWQLTGIPCVHGCQAILSIAAAPELFVDDCFKKSNYLKSYSNLMCPMKGSEEWPLANQLKLLPPKARRMPGRPKKNRIRGADEVGSGWKMSKKGVVMTCSRCLIIGHNLRTCKTSEAEAQENQRKAVEAKKAQAEAARAHSLRSKQNVRKKIPKCIQVPQAGSAGQAKKRGKPLQATTKHPENGTSQHSIEQHPVDNSAPEAPSTQEVPTEIAQKKRRGRPPKLQVRKSTAGVGVFVGNDGHTHMSSTRGTIRLTESQPRTFVQAEGEVASQPIL